MSLHCLTSYWTAPYLHCQTVCKRLHTSLLFRSIRCSISGFGYTYSTFTLGFSLFLGFDDNRKIYCDDIGGLCACRLLLGACLSVSLSHLGLQQGPQPLFPLFGLMHLTTHVTPYFHSSTHY